MHTIREYRDGDDFEALVDDGMDPLYVTQAHRMHGESRDGERWRRTLVATDGDRTIGAVTAIRSRLHPGHYMLAVEVARDRRREGIGTALVDAIRPLRPEPYAFMAKLRPEDPAASALQARLGGWPFQTCPCPVVEPSTVRSWCAAQPDPVGVTFAPLARLSEPERVDAWVEFYLWVHESWLPANPGVLREITPEIIADVDAARSVVAFREGRPAAVAWLFPEPNGPDTFVAETVHRDEPDGVPLLAATIAHCLSGASAPVEFDGHNSDPHLAPVVATLPAAVPRHPLHLVEIP
jgi:GNAT superfamily N-acetyltransferase